MVLIMEQVVSNLFVSFVNDIIQNSLRNFITIAKKFIINMSNNELPRSRAARYLSFPPPIGVEGRLLWESRLKLLFVHRLDPRLHGDDICFHDAERRGISPCF